MSDSLFTVLRGNPTDAELAALSTVLSQLDSEARAKAADIHSERNLWGQPGDVFNPTAFRNVRYY
ncbi:acyl-CoA carboxylase subunit epsilon [Corynebacterium sp. BF-R-2]|uniref:acyl-CoA carboxylase subunit epsilon n=1 Tax=Corynebacterium sp. BF-R-2 TaxID=2943494 RepID=UPI00211EBA82|nr:acyl-CoA carboxylase subunit epsilon [Corynebacterium sp. BF-R-2]MCQ9677342.1 acyl-CoA carboxylase subunit epsilon [Corynebacterium sp. BF-R-2]